MFQKITLILDRVEHGKVAVIFVACYRFSNNVVQIFGLQKKVEIDACLPRFKYDYDTYSRCT